MNQAQLKLARIEENLIDLLRTRLEKRAMKYLVIDHETDEYTTAASCQLVPLCVVSVNHEYDGGALEDLATETITDASRIRALYDHPTAEAYGDGSYTVELEENYPARLTQALQKVAELETKVKELEAKQRIGDKEN